MRLTLTDTGDGWTVTSPDLDGWSQLVVRADELWRAVASLSSRLDVAALSAEFDDSPSGGLLDELLDLALVDDNPKVRKAALAARSSLDRIQQVRDDERARWEADREERERQEKALADVAELERKLDAAKAKAREVGAIRRGRKPGTASKPSAPRSPAQQAAMRVNAEKARQSVEQNREREALRLRDDLLLLVDRGLDLTSICERESVKPNIVLRAVVPPLDEKGWSDREIAEALGTSMRQVQRYVGERAA